MRDLLAPIVASDASARKRADQNPLTWLDAVLFGRAPSESVSVGVRNLEIRMA
jgi:hypothetical protein